MKEGKKTNTRNKNTNKPNHSKVEQKPKVREVKIEENFFDEDDKNDKRLVVFSIIAILVILATIVTLVIGCDKKKQEEPEKPIDDIIVPEKKDEKEDEEDEGVVTREIVRKVTSVYKGSKTKEEDNEKTEDTTNTEEEKATYTVTFDYGDDATERKYDVEVEDGDVVEPYEPEGTYGCYYYTDQTWEVEFDFETPITENTTIYTACNLKDYRINYDVEVPEGSYDYYVIYLDDFELPRPTEDEGFVGWFTDEGTYENEIKNEQDIMDNATEVEEGIYTINLYAYFTGEGGDCEGDQCEVDPVEPTTGETGESDPVNPVEPTAGETGELDPVDPVEPTTGETEELDPVDPVEPTTGETGEPDPVDPVEPDSQLATDDKEKTTETQNSNITEPVTQPETVVPVNNDPVSSVPEEDKESTPIVEEQDDQKAEEGNE